MFISTCEMVGVGHPDKIADQIADAILDEVISLDRGGQVACEVLVSRNLVVISGEIFTNANFDYAATARRVLGNLGYDTDSFEFIVRVNVQSPNIRQSLFREKERIGAGDQGVVVGYACDETSRYIPLSHALCSDLLRTADGLIRNGTFNWAGRDMKILISMDGDGIDSLIFSIQHSDSVDHQFIVGELEKHLFGPVLAGQYGIRSRINKFINSSGKFVIGGLDADSGLTNRKIIADSYGLACRNGGGGYSGKDLTKADRLGAYYARWICKNLVASGLCRWAELEIIYLMGAFSPLSMDLRVDERSKYTPNQLLGAIAKVFPSDIYEVIGLFSGSNFKYQDLSTYGHFGRDDLNLPWERLDRVEELRAHFTNHG